MSEKINKFFIVLIPILVVGVGLNIIPFIVVLLALCVRLFNSDKHTAGIFLLLFGGILGSTIRFEFPVIPVYGLALNFIGLALIWDQFKFFKKESSSIQLMLFVLLYFFLAFIFSPNTNDYGATNKIIGIIQNGILMLFGYYAFIHSPKINNEILTQSLFFVTMLFLIHNMNLLGIAPSNLFDYEWQRKGSELVFKVQDNGETYRKFVNYQVVGMNALFGVCIYLSQLNINIRKALFYSIVGLQLVLTSGARQAIFGYFIVVILSLVVFNKDNLASNNFGNKLKYLFGGAILVLISFVVLQFLDLEFLTQTISEGDKGRDMLKVMGWNLFYQYPIFGAGIAGFNHAYPGMLYPHNFFIEVLCECGVFGAALLLVTVIYHFSRQRLSLLYLTRNGSFIFLIMAVTGIRMMVSNDLGSSIELFSIVFACSLTANEISDEEYV